MDGVVVGMFGNAGHDLVIPFYTPHEIPKPKILEALHAIKYNFNRRSTPR